MSPRIRSKLSYSNVIASLALFVALGGAAVAAGLPRNSVGPNQLKRGAVTAAKLRKGAVIPGKLSANAVGTGNIANGAVSAAKLAKNAVTNSAIANGVVGTNKLGSNAVTTVKIANGAVTPAKLGNEVAPLLGTLRGGQTLRGIFDLGQAPNVAAGTLTDSYTFPFPLSGQPAFGQANIVDMAVGSPAVTAACPGITGGNQETPQAAPGNLCVYITGKTNLDPTTPLASVNGPSRLGFALQAKAAAATTGFEAVGQWAVTGA